MNENQHEELENEDHQDDIESLGVEVERTVHGMVSDEKDRIIDTIISVYKRLPEDDLNVLRIKRCVQYVLPEQSTSQPTLINPILCDKSFEPFIPLWIISLRPELLDAPQSELIYVIAHELAHVYLEHAPGFPGAPSSEEKTKYKNPNCTEYDIEADQLVLNWGFEKELRSVDYNYIFSLCKE